MSENSDKPFEATTQKLQKARDKGEIAKSPEVNTLGLYLGCLMGATTVGPTALDRIVNTGGIFLSSAHNLEMTTAGTTAIKETITSTAILVAIPACTILAMIILQRSAVVAPSKLAPKLNRISIISGAKNKFGPSGLFEFIKSAFKMTVYTTLLTMLLWASSDTIIASSALPVGQSMMLILRISIYALLIVVGIAVILAIIDFAWQRRAHLEKNRMTKQEVQDEMKDSDGDPQFKARRRQRAQELASNRMLADVPNAAVVIVNPTHFAVALRWSAMDPTPPICLAKGVNHMAARIREAAEKAQVPIFSSPPTARALYATVKIGDPIPRDHFKAVAAAIRFAEGLKSEITEK